MAPGWSGATGIGFHGNRYCGRQINAPGERKADSDPACCAVHLDWTEPIFDPGQPEQYPEYLKEHCQ